MAYESGSFEAAIAAACGSDPDLRRELLQSYADSARQQVELLGRARCDGNWMLSAQRLRGLGASFHDGELVRLAERALESAPGDPAAVRELFAHIEALPAAR